MITEPEVDSIFAFDHETARIGAEHGMTPPWVCMSAAWEDENGNVIPALWGSHPEERDEAGHTLHSVLTNDDCLLLGQNVSYDIAVSCVEWPDLLPLFFEKLAKGLVEDTALNEKVLNLSDHGRLERIYAPDGKATDISYSLAALVEGYGGGSRAHLKKGDDIWRLNYEMLKGYRAADMPDEAQDYAIGDSVDAYFVRQAQVERAATTHAQMTGCRARAAMAFGYHLVTCRGIATDQKYLDWMKERVEEIAKLENLPLLLEHKLVTPAQPPRPHKRNKVHVPGCKKKGCDCPPKMCAPVEEKRNMEVIRHRCMTIQAEAGLDIKLTKTGKKKLGMQRVPIEELSSLSDEELEQVMKYVATDKEVVEALAPRDEVMGEYQKRQSVQKIDQDLGKVDGHEVIHPQFDTFKETTRTSSYHSKIIPSINIQQVANELAGIEPRRGYKPRDGHVFIDADYDALELSHVAQTTYNLFGDRMRCVHFEKINKGYDLHAFLGSQLALRKCPEFGSVLRKVGADTHEDDVYNAFLAMKAEGSKELADLFKHWRTFAKPTGLGFPGGLGPATMVDYAAATYGVVMSVQEATEVREFWRETYPEMPEYFKWCNQQIDEFNTKVGRTGDDEEEDVKPSPGYWYETPFGIVRRGARFCALANGRAMQSPAAEGFNTAIFNLQRACYDPTMGSPLYGGGVVVPLHDQAVVEFPSHDMEALRAAAAEVKRILVEAMQFVCPDVRVNADPILCSRWSKAAYPVANDEGQLEIWHPKENPHLTAA